jgi:hypothetical protein
MNAMNEDRNEIERVAKRLMETTEAKSVLDHASLHAFLKDHPKKHMEGAIAWTMTRKGQLRTRPVDVLVDTGVTKFAEPSYSPNGYWIPRIHAFVAYAYYSQGREIEPDISILKTVKAALRIENTHDILVKE